MSLPIQSFDELVQSQFLAMQQRSSVPLYQAPGGVLRALVETNASNSIWLQALATALLAVTRLSTSSENDVDTFIQDFGFSRFLGSSSSGTVAFSRNVTTIQAVIPVGAVVSESTSATVTFTVSSPPPNSSYPAYDPDLNSYVIPISTASVNVYVICNVNGTQGNALAGQIDTINGSFTGVSAVTNASAFTNGLDEWSDQQTKSEFVLYLLSLARATMSAIEFSVISVPGVIRFALNENVNQDNIAQIGFFTVVIDDGTGSPSDDLIAAVNASVDLYRGFTIQYTVAGPETTSINISLHIHLQANPTSTQAEVTAAVTSAINLYTSTLPFNSVYPYTRIPELTYDADPNVLNVTTILLNSGTSDLNPSQNEPQTIFVPGTITITYI